MPKVRARDIEFHYQTRGEGPEVILLHGLCSSLATWYNGIFPSLVASGFRVTAYDMRGHGLSDLTKNGYSSDEMANDLGAVLDALSIDRALILGHSYGGAVCMHFTLLNPGRVRGAVLLDSSIACLRYLRKIDDWEGWETPGFKEKGLTAEWFRVEDGKQDMSEYLRKTLSIPRVRGFKRGQVGLSPRIQKLLDQTQMGSEFREIAGLTEEAMREIQVPVLALHGENSPSTRMAERLGDIVPNCHADIMKDLGHLAALHDPNPILARITPFFQDPEGYIQRAKSQRTGILEPPLQTSTSPLT